jgi:hypothetical protein
MQMNFFIALRASRAALTEMVSSALLGIPHETPGQPAQITPFGRNRPRPGQATAERQIGGS